MAEDDASFTLVRRFNAAGHADDGSSLDELLAPDFVAHNPDGDVHGADGWREFLAASEAEFGPSETGIDELIHNGSLVAERWWIRSVPKGSEPVSHAHGITMHRIVDGRIAEQWAVLQGDD